MNEDQRGIIEQAARAIHARLRGPFPATVLVLGSGLGRFADNLADTVPIPYAEIPGFTPPAVPGHAGKLIVGRLGKTPLAVMQGRVHAYEGHGGPALAIPIRTLKVLGAATLLLTNAAGGLAPAMTPGTLMVIEDHINFGGFNPLIGPNDDGIGPRFPDMTAAYDPILRAELRAAAARAGVAVASGVYLYTLGPNFETPAEVRMFAGLGAHAVGMSTVPECLVARHCGLKVAGLSLITNLAAGIASHPLTHAETLAAADEAYERVARLLTSFLQQGR